MVLKNPNEYQKGKTIVILVRHGDRDENDKDVPHHLGPRLSKKGINQAKYVASQLASIKEDIDVFVCSTMTRAKETAKYVSNKIGKKPTEIEDISEFNKILWSGKIYHPKFWKHYSKHRKSMKAIDSILEKNKGKIILIVGHGNVFKGFIGKKMGLSLREIERIEQSNCHITLARFNGKKLDYLYYLNSKDLVHPDIER